MYATFNFDCNSPFWAEHNSVKWSSSNSMNFIQRIMIWLRFHWNIQLSHLASRTLHTVHTTHCTLRLILLCDVWRKWTVLFVNINFHFISVVRRFIKLMKIKIEFIHHSQNFSLKTQCTILILDSRNCDEDIE